MTHVSCTMSYIGPSCLIKVKVMKEISEHTSLYFFVEEKKCDKTLQEYTEIPCESFGQIFHTSLLSHQIYLKHIIIYCK